jgi:hypothetical protein
VFEETFLGEHDGVMHGDRRRGARPDDGMGDGRARRRRAEEESQVEK